jgi:hypothetical protein
MDQGPRGWLYLQTDETKPDTSCVLLTGDDDTEKFVAYAWSLGFRSLGLCAQDLKDYFAWTKELIQHDPSDAELARFFCYYFHSDKVIPSMDTPDLPPFMQAEMDREFYDSLGAERGHRVSQRWLSARGCPSKRLLPVAPFGRHCTPPLPVRRLKAWKAQVG